MFGFSCLMIRCRGVDRKGVLCIEGGKERNLVCDWVKGGKEKDGGREIGGKGNGGMLRK